MATTKNFETSLKKYPSVWLGHTATEGKSTFVFYNADGYHVVGVTVDSKGIFLEADSKTVAMKQDILDMLALFGLNKGEPGERALSSLPEDFKTIVGDYNEYAYSKGIKILPKDSLLEVLDDFGIDHSGYEYTDISVDNSFTLNFTPMVTGYDKYSEDIVNIMTDTSEHKASPIILQPQVFKRIRDGVKRFYIFEGPQGCGKSTEPDVYGAILEKPVIHVNCHGALEFNDACGEILPNTAVEELKEEASKPSMSQQAMFRLVKKALALGFEHGALVVLDEINAATMVFVLSLHSLFDGVGQMILSDGTVIKRHDSFACICTMNPSTFEGVNDLNPAFIDRFDVVHFGRISKDIFKRIMQYHTDYKNEKFLDKLFEISEKLHTFFTDSMYKSDTSIRRNLSFLIDFLQYPEDIEWSFNTSFCEQLRANSDILDDSIYESEIQPLINQYVKELTEIYNEGNSSKTKPVALSLKAKDLLNDYDKVISEMAEADGIPMEEEE